MKDWISLLDVRERRIAGILCALVGVSLVFLAFVLVRERTAAGRSVKQWHGEEQGYRTLSLQRDEAQREFQRWQEAVRDVQELEGSYFYDQKSTSQNLQVDLQQVLASSGINLSQVKYDYSEFAKEGIAKVETTFTISGTYAALKKFLDTVEGRRKFIFVEKIAFSQIASQGGLLDLRINLAGYYVR